MFLTTKHEYQINLNLFGWLNRRQQQQQEVDDVDDDEKITMWKTWHDKIKGFFSQTNNDVAEYKWK